MVVANEDCQWDRCSTMLTHPEVVPPRGHTWCDVPSLIMWWVSTSEAVYAKIPKTRKLIIAAATTRWTRLMPKVYQFKLSRCPNHKTAQVGGFVFCAVEGPASTLSSSTLASVWPRPRGFVC